MELAIKRENYLAKSLNVKTLTPRFHERIHKAT